jgi:NAD(P)-dependent dehydrogenase (short-subunit alcohol dehydrogenase family)
VSTVLVTGATDGLGRAVATELSARGHAVIVHGRSAERAAGVAREIGAAGTRVADFAALDDARRLAAESGGVDVLVNNAGVIVPERRVSRDGHELTFQVNYLAGFLLTMLLLPARTVNVASVGQRPLDFADLMLERGYDGYGAYAQSKLAQIMFTFELAERRPDLQVNALHPATLMDTKMARETFGRTLSTVAEGVEATVRVIDLDGVSGRYYDGTHESHAHAQAYDHASRARLWEISEQLTGLA